jgi:Peptidase family M48
VREVAGKVGTRPVDNIYLTPGTDLAVMERGGLLRQLASNTERCFILGVGVIDGMTVGPFKAILAHEYGHFSNRDTAGGGFALSVRRSLITMAMNLAESGAAEWYNPAWLFVNGFHRVFLRISQGASRLQEVLADRWAAFSYGARSFERGLRHVIERSIRFDVHANAAINEVINKRLPLSNLYAYQPSKIPVSDQEVASAIEEALNAQPSPYDSHPAPLDRFRWVHAIGETAAASSPDDEADVWTLFRDREEVERRLTHEVRKNVHEQTAITIPEAQMA